LFLLCIQHRHIHSFTTRRSSDLTEKKKVKQIYFEGNINSYTYADEGASLYDVLNLYNEKHHLIKDKLIKAMKDLDELEDYIEKRSEEHTSELQSREKIVCRLLLE